MQCQLNTILRFTIKDKSDFFLDYGMVLNKYQVIPHTNHVTIIISSGPGLGNGCRLSENYLDQGWFVSNGSLGIHVNSLNGACVCVSKLGHHWLR